MEVYKHFSSAVDDVYSKRGKKGPRGKASSFMVPIAKNAEWGWNIKADPNRVEVEEEDSRATL